MIIHSHFDLEIKKERTKLKKKFLARLNWGYSNMPKYPKITKRASRSKGVDSGRE